MTHLLSQILLEEFVPRAVFELENRFFFDLPHTLTRQIKVLADLVKRVGPVPFQTVK